jgi:hypothetical protein
MGTFLGLAGSTTNETGVINIGLPVLAEVTDLTIFISVAANSASPSDKVELRNITLTGTPKPVIIDICLNINGIQAEVPDGYQINVSGECVVIPPTPIDICLNLAGLQETLPVGYEKNDLGQCIETPPIVDICPNISEVQLVVPEGMVVNSAGNCELASVPALDICPNLEGEQIILPTGYEINSFGHCIVIVTENPPPTPPAPKPKQCPKGFSKWIEKFNESHIWRADDVYRAVILVGGPTNRSSNRDRAHFLYIAGPTEVGDKYYRRFHKISQVCVKG